MSQDQDSDPVCAIVRPAAAMALETTTAMRATVNVEKEGFAIRMRGMCIFPLIIGQIVKNNNAKKWGRQNTLSLRRERVG